MLKELFHRNSIKIFSALEHLGLAKIARFFLAKKLNNNLKISLPVFMLATPELQKSNDWYGHATALKKYAGIKNDYSLKAAIEHGPFFGDFIWPQDLQNPLPAIITFSKNRGKFLRKKTNKRISSIGPYIHYAQPSLTPKQFNKEKKRLGKNLLVFPVHSTSISPSDYDIENFCREIKRVAKNFDSVRVCLYWKDILHGKDEYFKKQGFGCATAGHIFDPMFLPRLKSIIELSSATMSNAFGSQLGYSVFMKKPHYLFVQKIKFSGNNLDVKRALYAAKTKEYRDMEKAFSKYSNNVTKKQYDLASSFFGFDQIKSPKQIKKIFEVCENLWQKDLY